MTAKISPTINMGRRTPVEFLAPKMKTNMATIMTLIPLIPDLDKPRIKAARKRMKNSVRLSSMPFKYDLKNSSFFINKTSNK
jgi:hypothetical protein